MLLWSHANAKNTENKIAEALATGEHMSILRDLLHQIEDLAHRSTKPNTHALR